MRDECSGKDKRNGGMDLVVVVVVSVVCNIYPNILGGREGMWARGLGRDCV